MLRGRFDRQLAAARAASDEERADKLHIVDMSLALSEEVEERKSGLGVRATL
jgi:hypothetical protein